MKPIVSKMGKYLVTTYIIEVEGVLAQSFVAFLAVAQLTYVADDISTLQIVPCQKKQSL
jgi:hypothetical protein